MVKYEAVISQNGHYSMRLKEQQLCEEGLKNRSESCIHVPCALCFIQPLCAAIHMRFYPWCLSALVNVLIWRPNVYSRMRIPAICTDMKTSWRDVSKTCRLTSHYTILIAYIGDKYREVKLNCTSISAYSMCTKQYNTMNTIQ